MTKRILVGEALRVEEGYEEDYDETLGRIAAALEVEPRHSNDEDFYALTDILAAMLTRIIALEEA